MVISVKKIVNTTILVFLSFIACRTLFTIFPITPVLLGGVVLLLIVWKRLILPMKVIIPFCLYYGMVFYDFVVLENQGIQEMLFTSFVASMELACLFIIYYFSRYNIYAWKRAAWVMFSFIVWSLLITCFINLLIPGYYRDMYVLSGMEEDKAFRRMYESFGVISYMMFHMISLLLPFLVFVFKMEKKIKFKCLALFCLLFFLYALFSASITTALGVGCLAVCVAYIYPHKKNNIGMKIILFFCICILYFWGKELLIWGLDILQPLAEGSKMYDKISHIQSGLIYGDQSTLMEGRNGLYESSWDAFADNLLVGCHERSRLGGHSFIADRLGYWGMLGVLPLFCFLFLQIRMPIKFINSKVRPYYYISLLPCVIMAFLKNIYWFETCYMVFLIIPGLYIWASDRYFVQCK